MALTHFWTIVAYCLFCDGLGWTHRRALRQLVRGNHLHIQVLGLGLPS